MKNSKSNIGAQIIITFLLIAIALAFVYPFVWMLITSFKTNVQIRTDFGTFWPDPWSLDGYITAITEAPMFQWLINSLIVSISVTTIVVFTSTLAGFVFAKYSFKFKEAIFLVFLATMMIPSQVTMIPSFLIVNALNLYNSILALIIPSMISAFGIFLTRQFIEDTPNALCEAARIDGASDFGIYRNIILPNIKPAIGSLTIFTFLATWNNYMGPLIMLNDEDKMTLPLALTFFASKNGTNLAATMAVASLIMMPVIVVFIIFQKDFIKGLSLSGIK